MAKAIRNAHNQWKAETLIDVHAQLKDVIEHAPTETIKLSVVTMKRSNNMVATTVSLGRHQSRDGYTSVSTSPFSDFNATLERTERRASQRSVEVQHSRYESANEIERIIEAALAHYAVKTEASDV